MVKVKDRRHDGTLGKNSKSIRPLDKIYRPTDREPFMNQRQREYFRVELLDWREDILKVGEGDAAKSPGRRPKLFRPRRPRIVGNRPGYRTTGRRRQRKLIAKIDAALQRIEDGAYGYCEETGEPISLKRLEARPIATLSIEAQEQHERRERVYREE